MIVVVIADLKLVEVKAEVEVDQKVLKSSQDRSLEVELEKNQKIKKIK